MPGDPRSGDTTPRAEPPDRSPRGVEVTERSGGTHFPGLDAYRGIGMTLVLLNHAAYATGFIQRAYTPGATTAERILGPIIARFDVVVPMFFVLSAFLLFRPYALSLFGGRAAPGPRVFLRRRVLRIFPAYWVALAGIGLLVGLPIAGGVWGWIGNALMLPAFGVPVEVCNDAGVCHVGYGITQAWSVGIEVTFYLLLPVFARGLARWTRRSDRDGARRRVAAAVAAAYLAGAAFRAVVVVAEPTWSAQSLLWLPMFLDVFAVGLALAAVSAWVATGGALWSPLRWLSDHPAVAWGLVAVALLALSRWKPPAEPFGLNGYEYIPRQLVYGCFSAVWLAPALFGDQSRGHLRAFLASRPMVFLGAISLSFYLWHLDIIEQVKAWTVPDYAARRALAAQPPPDNPLAALATFTGNFAKVAAVSWVLSFAVASLLHRVVELPFLRLKDEPLRRLVRRRRPSGPGA